MKYYIIIFYYLFIQILFSCNKQNREIKEKITLDQKFHDSQLVFNGNNQSSPNGGFQADFNFNLKDIRQNRRIIFDFDNELNVYSFRIHESKFEYLDFKFNLDSNKVIYLDYTIE